MDNIDVVKIIKSNKSIKIIPSSSDSKFLANNIITVQDAEMDKRAREAVKSAVAKAKVCSKPIAKYDITTKRVYLEYSNGEKKYVR